MEKSYDSEVDAFYQKFSNKDYWKSVELAEGIILDIDYDGEIIGIEILNASKLFKGDSKKVLESTKLIKLNNR